jgi:hypothetical protein
VEALHLRDLLLWCNCRAVALAFKKQEVLDLPHVLDRSCIAQRLESKVLNSYINIFRRFSGEAEYRIHQGQKVSDPAATGCYRRVSKGSRCSVLRQSGIVRNSNTPHGCVRQSEGKPVQAAGKNLLSLQSSLQEHAQATMAAEEEVKDKEGISHSSVSFLILHHWSSTNCSM